jgi:hypothetical protein
MLHLANQKYKESLSFARVKQKYPVLMPIIKDYNPVKKSFHRLS